MYLVYNYTVYGFVYNIVVWSSLKCVIEDRNLLTFTWQSFARAR
jgi:hypothetical protein